ncbi:LpqN/LpqT family lipoprotein [[Mycobacterium] kokjensenii]|uniref:LpqN/LpqT family lipoprotein n=1 Tax=[Mycobacterium] kokjensenii TaxID=3064287 RepID=A0ABN9MT75_9MYCO|nr:LpqN/LpqT family lipoprotein [Mycolicibacter sp. MU0083]CAJ1494755.1 LpqN/LpqT family lipoprotein [Mycolicibacter sp. MU0083]
MRWATVAWACLALAGTVSGCGAKTPDYQSIWSNGTTTTTSTEPEAPVTVGRYLEDQGVVAEAVAPDAPTDLSVTIPTPAGWTRKQSSLLPDTTLALGKGEKYPRAILSVVKLTGNFDSGEAIKHGIVDAQLSPKFKLLDASNEDYQGFPSSMVQGTYDMDGQRLHSWFRMVIATGSAPAEQRYLVQLAVTAPADEAPKHATDVEAIMKGFNVAAK